MKKFKKIFINENEGQEEKKRYQKIR